LFEASVAGHLDIVKELIKAGANLNVPMMFIGDKIKQEIMNAKQKAEKQKAEKQKAEKPLPQKVEKAHPYCGIPPGQPIVKKPLPMKAIPQPPFPMEPKIPITEKFAPTTAEIQKKFSCNLKNANALDPYYV